MGSHPYYLASILVLQTGYLHHATKTFDVHHKNTGCKYLRAEEQWEEGINTAEYDTL